MKKLLLLFLLFSTHSIYGQLINDYNYKRDTASFKNSKLITKTTIDSSGVIQNKTTIKQYNEMGFLSSEQEFDESGKTTSLIIIDRPDQFTEIEYYSEPKLKGDTATYNYNKDGFLIQEQWSWGENGEVDKATFTYNHQNKLIKETELFEFGYFYDTLIYQNNKLVTILSYDKKYGLEDSIAYHYNSEGQLIEIKSYDSRRNLNSSKKYLHFYQNKPTLIEKNYIYYDDQIFKDITKIEYFENGKKKSEHIQSYNINNLIWEAKSIYSKKGFLKKYKHTDFERNIAKTSTTILEKNS